MRVLIVEDDERLAEIFRDFIGELGYQPFIVGSAEDALSALAAARPDAIMLDVRLPGMSGVEFLSQTAVRESEVPVVVVSGVATENEARACLKLGALDFIRKPVTLERLGQVLAYLRPFALARRPSGEERVIERRPAPRAVMHDPDAGNVAHRALVDGDARPREPAHARGSGREARLHTAGRRRPDERRRPRRPLRPRERRLLVPRPPGARSLAPQHLRLPPPPLAPKQREVSRRGRASPPDPPSARPDRRRLIEPVNLDLDRFAFDEYRRQQLESELTVQSLPCVRADQDVGP